MCIPLYAKTADAASPYRWAYMLPDAADPDTFHFYAVNLTGPDDSLFSIKANFAPDIAHPSPDGKWIAFGYSPTNGMRFDGLLRLMNMNTGDIHVTGPVAMIDGDEHYMEVPQDVYWSPDSRYIAYSNKDSQSNTHLYVYDMQTGTQTELGVDNDHYFVAWSNDSISLVVQARHCNNSLCHASFDIYSIEKLLSSIPFSPYGRDFPTNADGWEACKINWSPDNKVISFVWHCNDTFLAANNVYLIDVQRQLILPVTHVEKELGHYDTFARQAPAWINDDTLLIGSWAQQILIPISDTDTPTPKTISRTVRFPDGRFIFAKSLAVWWLNRSSGRVAYEFASDELGKIADTVNLGVVKNGSVMP